MLRLLSAVEAKNAVSEELPLPDTTDIVTACLIAAAHAPVAELHDPRAIWII